MKYDIRKLRVEVKAKEQEIRDLKGILRESHQPRKTETRYLFQEKPPRYEWGTQDALLRSKSAATRLYQLRAHMHGRIHRKGQTWEDQVVEVGSGLNPYVIKEEVVPAA